MQTSLGREELTGLPAPCSNDRRGQRLASPSSGKGSSETTILNTQKVGQYFSKSYLID